MEIDRRSARSSSGMTERQLAELARGSMLGGAPAWPADVRKDDLEDSHKAEAVTAASAPDGAYWRPGEYAYWSRHAGCWRGKWSKTELKTRTGASLYSLSLERKRTTSALIQRECSDWVRLGRPIENLNGNIAWSAPAKVKQLDTDDNELKLDPEGARFSLRFLGHPDNLFSVSPIIVDSNGYPISDLDSTDMTKIAATLFSNDKDETLPVYSPFGQYFLEDRYRYRNDLYKLLSKEMAAYWSQFGPACCWVQEYQRWEQRSDEYRSAELCILRFTQGGYMRYYSYALPSKWYNRSDNLGALTFARMRTPYARSDDALLLTMDWWPQIHTVLQRFDSDGRRCVPQIAGDFKQAAEKFFAGKDVPALVGKLFEKGEA